MVHVHVPNKVVYVFFIVRSSAAAALVNSSFSPHAKANQPSPVTRFSNLKSFELLYLRTSSGYWSWRLGLPSAIVPCPFPNHQPLRKAAEFLEAVRHTMLLQYHHICNSCKWLQVSGNLSCRGGWNVGSLNKVLNDFNLNHLSGLCKYGPTYVI